MARNTIKRMQAAWIAAIIAIVCGMPGAMMASPEAMEGKLPMEDTSEVRHVSVSIHRPPNVVYDFITDGDNFTRWARGLGEHFRRSGDEWIAQGPLGTVRVRIVKRNEFGVADHDVILPTGATIHNPIRVIPNGTGSTVTFTVMRMAGISDAKFDEDARAVEKDLLTLKALLEKQ